MAALGKFRRIARRSSSSVILASSNIGGFVLPLVRGIFLARLLSPAEFGLAISITVVAGIAEMLTDLGVAQMAVRSGTMENAGTLHAISIVRGLFLGVVIALSGPLFAWLFHSPGTGWAYGLVGLASLIRSFGHIDIKIRMRGYDYASDALTSLGSHVTSTVVTIGLAYWLRDYRAMPIGLVAFSVAYVLISHLTSRMPWRLAWNREIVRHSVAFGRPLLMNGFASVLTQMGDRALTGAKISLDQLAHYSVLATSAFMPRNAISSFLTSIFVPHLVNAKSEAERRRLADFWIIILSILGTVFALGYIAFGHDVIALVFGAKYQVDQTLIGLVALLACTRYMAGLPLAPGLASGQTSLIFAAAMASTLGLAIGAILLFHQPTLPSLIAGMFIGETAALLWVARRCLARIPSTPVVAWVAIILPLIGLVGLCTALSVIGNSLEARLGLCAVGLGLEAILVPILLRLSRSTVWSLGLALMPEKVYAR